MVMEVIHGSIEKGVYDRTEKSPYQQISALWARSNAALKPKPFFKNIPRRIFKDRRDAEGVPVWRGPPIPIQHALGPTSEFRFRIFSQKQQKEMHSEVENISFPQFYGF